MYLRYMFRVFCIVLDILHSESLNIEDTSYKATNDFIFESRSRPDILYNPKYLEVAKRIDLSPLSDSIAAIKRLLRNYNSSCYQERQHIISQYNKPTVIKIPGKSLSVTDGLHLCKNLGNGYKLLELHKKEEMTSFIAQTPEKKFATPAGIFYDLRQHDFVYASSNRPVTSKSAIFRFENGVSIETYRYWDSYSDYFGQYVVDNSQIYINVAASELRYDHVYCIAPKSSLETYGNIQICEQELKFISEISSVTIYHVEKLNEFLDTVWRTRKNGPNFQRGRRGIATGAVLSADIGGTAGIITTKVISALGQDDNLNGSIKKTEEVLDSLKERANLLDINQKRIFFP